jgi:uncharacterized Zn-binding protein involved in type VI secretion
MVNGKLNTYENYEDIPKRFDHVIEFAPDIIPGPHTEEEHREMDSWNSKLQDLMKRELK